MSKYVFIISSMRAGSTLLKALLATRTDISHFPETPFLHALTIKAVKPIIVIKFPRKYEDVDYPQLPGISSKNIVLVRHPYETILSLQKMNLENFPEKIRELNKVEYLLDYWIKVYHGIKMKIDLHSTDTLIVKYEDMIQNSILTIQKIFEFVGCRDSSATEAYDAPTDYEWKWGYDDGGTKIKSLKIQKEVNARVDLRLDNLINCNTQIQNLLKQYGY